MTLIRLEISWKTNAISLSGSPFKFHVDSIASGYVTAYGSGLVAGVTGEPALFTISTKGAGAGGLSMAVEGPSKAEVSWSFLYLFVCDKIEMYDNCANLPHR